MGTLGPCGAEAGSSGSLGLGSGTAQPCGLGPGLGRGESGLLVPTCWPLESQKEQRCAGAWTPQPSTPVLTTQQPVLAASWWEIPLAPGATRISVATGKPGLGAQGPPVQAQAWMKPQQLSPGRRVWMSVPGGEHGSVRAGLAALHQVFIPSQPYTREGV